MQVQQRNFFILRTILQYCSNTQYILDHWRLKWIPWLIELDHTKEVLLQIILNRSILSLNYLKELHIQNYYHHIIAQLFSKLFFHLRMHLRNFFLDYIIKLIYLKKAIIKDGLSLITFLFIEEFSIILWYHCSQI